MKFNHKSLVFVPTNTAEIDRAFHEAGNGDPELYNDTCGESLQYMGTVIEPTAFGIRVYHELRHRAMPGTNQRKYFQIEASSNFKTAITLNQIEFEAVMELTT